MVAKTGNISVLKHNRLVKRQLVIGSAAVDCHRKNSQQLDTPSGGEENPKHRTLAQLFLYLDQGPRITCLDPCKLVILFTMHTPRNVQQQLLLWNTAAVVPSCKAASTAYLTNEVRFLVVVTFKCVQPFRTCFRISQMLSKRFNPEAIPVFLISVANSFYTANYFSIYVILSK